MEPRERRIVAQAAIEPCGTTSMTGLADLAAARGPVHGRIEGRSGRARRTLEPQIVEFLKRPLRIARIHELPLLAEQCFVLISVLVADERGQLGIARATLDVQADLQHFGRRPTVLLRRRGTLRDEPW
jgi:hypothetical protein